MLLLSISEVVGDLRVALEVVKIPLNPSPMQNEGESRVNSVDRYEH